MSSSAGGGNGAWSNVVSDGKGKISFANWRGTPSGGRVPATSGTPSRHRSRGTYRRSGRPHGRPAPLSRLGRTSSIGCTAATLALLVAAAAFGTSPAFAVTLSATPSPTDPLQFTFAAGAITGTPTGYNWSFGDGHYLNGSGAGFAAPVHRYITPGNYTVTVVVAEGTQRSSQSLVVDALPAALHVAIQVTNVSGKLPDTATFTATITGGTGTFQSVLWSFGDGGRGVGSTIQYSFVRSGNFQVVLTVTDSAGTTASGSTWFNVSGTLRPSGSEGGGVSGPILAGTALVAGLGGIIAGIWYGRYRSRRAVAEAERAEEVAESDLARREAAAEGPSAPAAASAAGAAPRPSSLPQAALPVVGAPEPGRPNGLEPPSTGPQLAAPSTSPASEPSPAEVALAVPATSALPPARPALHMSQRIVLHLATQGSLDATEVAPVGFTQLGISQSLSVRQNALTNVLRRLVAAGVLTEDVRHVRGQPRRLKVYRLTPRGEALSHDLRAHGHGTAPPGDRSR